MSRSLWKGPFLDKGILLSLRLKRKPLNWMKIYSRRSVIPSSLIGQKVAIYNGHSFKRLHVLSEHVGFKFGEFSSTRKFMGKQKAAKKRVIKKK